LRRGETAGVARSGPDTTIRLAGGNRRLLHYNEAASLKMVDEPLGNDPRHHFRGVMLPLAPVEAERERKRVGEVFWRGWREGGRVRRALRNDN
jgi:hypothetical protein